MTASFWQKKSLKGSLKGLLCLALAATLGLTGLSSCAVLSESSPAASKSDAGSDQATKLKIIASVFAPYDFAKTICADAADVSMLVPPGSESHSYEPSPRDIIDLQNADLFIYVGGESDRWLEAILESLDAPNLKTVRLLDLVPTLEEVQLEGMQAENDGNDGAGVAADPEPDEHVWTSIANAQLIVQSLSASLAAWDKANAEQYEQNAATYLQKLQALDQSYQTVVNNAQRKTLVFGDRFPFRYLANEYGLECYAAFSGCSTAVDTNPQTIKFLIDKVDSLKLPTVFYIELSSHKIADAIAETTGVQTLELHACHNISQQDFAAQASYLDLMYKNLSNLEVALN